MNIDKSNTKFRHDLKLIINNGAQPAKPTMMDFGGLKWGPVGNSLKPEGGNPARAIPNLLGEIST